jgi:hypothetical protein
MNTKITPPEMTDGDLNWLLSQASAISVPHGAEERALHAAVQMKVASVPPRWALRFALPLAASLVLGIYLGAGGYGENYLTTSTSTASTEDATLFSTGFEEAVATAEENLT